MWKEGGRPKYTYKPAIPVLEDFSHAIIIKFSIHFAIHLAVPAQAAIDVHRMGD